MEDMQHKIHEAVKMEPDYSRLDTLSYDVMRKVRVAETSSGPSFQVPFFSKLGLLLYAVWLFWQYGRYHLAVPHISQTCLIYAIFLRRLIRLLPLHQ